MGYEGRQLLLLAAVLGGVGLYLLWVAVRRWRIHGARRRLPLLTGDRLGDGSPEVTCRVEGQAVAGPRGPLTAPISGRPCVWYHVTVTKAWGRWGGDGRSQRGEKVLFSEGGSWPFALRDEAGQVLVEPDETMMHGVTRSARRNSDKADPRFKLPNAALGKKYEYREWLIPQGQPLHVVGRAGRDPETGASRVSARRGFGSGTTPGGRLFLISALTDAQRAWRVRLLFASGLALVAAGAAVAALG